MTSKNMTYEPEVKDSDLLAAIREWEGTPAPEPNSGRSDPEPRQQQQGQQGNAQATAGDIEATINRLLEARLPAAVDARLGTLDTKLNRLEAMVTSATNKGTEVPQAVWDALQTIGKEVRDIRFDNLMSDADRVEFLEKERAAEAAYQQQLAQQEQQEAQRNSQLQSDQASYEAQVNDQHGSFFRGTLMKHLVEVAATYGVSEEEATNDAKALKVNPTTDARTGWLNGYDWDTYQNALNEKWGAVSTRRDTGRTQSRSGGDTGRAAQGAAGSFDEWDPKWHTNGGSISDMVLAGVRLDARQQNSRY